MNQLAKTLNEQISNVNPSVYEMLSSLGKQLYMPQGIITQSAEAKQKAHKFNATIGIAADSNGPLYLNCLHESMSAMTPAEIFPYAPTTGVMELRKAWKDKMIVENPLVVGKNFSLPVVTSALTHGLNIVADMFTDEGDCIILPDKFWGNYRLTFSVMRRGEIVTYNSFTDDGKFDTAALLEKVRECGSIKGKAIVILNFPNNPTGYTPSTFEMNELANGLTEIADSGVKLIVVTDDAYFGLFYDNSSFKESIFSLLTERSVNLLPIKLDGATKEDFAWGLRVGFITFGSTGGDCGHMLQALETKVAGQIRGTISNCAMPSQSAVLRCLRSKDFKSEAQALFATLKVRWEEVVKVLAEGGYGDEFVQYPFNSGYFMCVKLSRVEAEKLRIHLLEKYGVGVISTSSTDIRVAFSCVEKQDIKELFDIIYRGCKEL